MAEHPLANPKWTLPEVSALSALTRRRVMETVQRNLAAMGDVRWSDVVNDRTMELFSAEDGERIARQVADEFMLEAGRKLLAGAEVAVRENPDLYVLRSDWMAAQESLEGLADLEEDAIGLGDNVFAEQDFEGTVLVVRQVAEVDRLMREGVPAGTIGVIDDAGGTMTAPILPEFEAVLCRAGTVRSHLAIIAREYGVPTLMGVQLRRELVTGERIKVQYSAAPQSADAYHGGEVSARARIWGGLMSDWEIDEERLLRLNNTLSRADDVIIYNCITRTAQESKLFPLMPYLMLCFYDAYYRFPDLIREASEHISPEEIGHRVRESSMLPSKLSAWGTLNFYLNGRASLIKLGLLTPEDNLEDLVTVVDWWERFNRSYHRNSGRLWSYDQGDMSPELPERVLQVMEADAWEADDRLRKAASRFMATGTQYLFLANCESRLTLQASGPYRLGDNLLMHTRDFMNLGASDYSWLDGIADDMPYSNLTLSVITRDVAIEITDWAQIYTSPEDYQDKILGVGLYTSDWLTDTYQPVGMGSPTELADTLEAITDKMAQATRRLYTRFTEMSARQMTEAGVYVYLAAASGISHLAGTYQHEQWELIDHRTDRLWALHNEEYSLDSYLDNFAVMAGHQASQNEYYLHPIGYSGWRKGGGKGPLPAPGRNAFPVPSTVLSDHDYTRRVNPKGMASVQGVNHLPPKSGGWLTSRGTLSQDELNRAVREFRSPLAEAPWVNYDEQWVKWNAGTPEADELYRHVQRGSRLLDGAGSSLLRDDLMKRRAAAGESSWSDLSGGGGSG